MFLKCSFLQAARPVNCADDLDFQRFTPGLFRHAPNLTFAGGFFPAMASANIGTIRIFHTRRFHSKAVNG
jgi:hypothetical protein